MTNPLINKRILLGVTGSIACYKSADLASKLRQAGAEVDVILTEAAVHFIAPLTFQSVTGRKAFTDADLWGDQGHVLHIGLAKDANILLIAPATANTLAKLAHGEAGNLLTLTALTAECPVAVAPAMDGGMYTNPATQANLQTLQERGVTIIGPEEGHLASGLKAAGRMTEPQDLLGHLRFLLAQDGPLAGRKVVVSAGATQEPIDPVRYITNRSSGRQGFALAQAALDKGAQVVLVTGPNQLQTPIGIERIDVRTAEQMAGAVLTHAAEADVLVMAAAVADFRPKNIADNKIKKDKGMPTIELESTTDILRTVAGQIAKTGRPRIMVGFAAESQDLLNNAQKKLESKELDMIVANDISASDAGFAVETNRVTLLFADGEKEEMPLMGKDEVAGKVIEKVIELLEKTK